MAHQGCGSNSSRTDRTCFFLHRNDYFFICYSQSALGFCNQTPDSPLSGNPGFCGWKTTPRPHLDGVALETHCGLGLRSFIPLNNAQWRGSGALSLVYGESFFAVNKIKEQKNRQNDDDQEGRVEAVVHGVSGPNLWLIFKLVAPRSSVRREESAGR
jgi:hypothetical protein